MTKLDLQKFDIEKLDKAIIFTQRIADGYDPVDNKQVENDSVLNKPQLIRCLNFIKEVLVEVRKNKGYVGKQSRNSDKRPFPLEVTKEFSYEEDKSITKLVQQLNAPLDLEVYQQLSYKLISQWLVRQGILQEQFFEKYNKSFKVPTVEGMELGIRIEERDKGDGTGYIFSLYGQQAQEYIVNNLEEILRGEAAD